MKYGTENSRIDLLLQAPDKIDCYIEVKSVTLLQHECGYFPDAVTLRGQKHLRELQQMVSNGKRAVLFSPFSIQESSRFLLPGILIHGMRNYLSKHSGQGLKFYVTAPHYALTVLR